MNSNSLTAGTVLKGRSRSYEIVKTLGQGSFGITYLAKTKVQMDGELGSFSSTMYVAIKEFFMKEINGREGTTVTSGSKGGLFDDYRRKFVREATNLSKLKHPNIINVLESFEVNNTCYYVMEYIDGGSLDDMIARQHGLSEADVVKYVRQIASALAFMHDNKMLHLDLKPGNVMINDGHAVLIDFGLSKQYDASGEPESSTTIGSGTPGYAPLEQANHRDGNGFPVTMDVYALGATMFKMLTGKRPPEATNILNEGFPVSELSDCEVSSHTVMAVEKAMAPVKKKRYPNVTAFLKGLESTEIEDVTIIETPIKPKPKPKPKYQPQPIPTPLPDPVPDSTPNHKWIWYVASVLIIIGAIAIWRINSDKDTPSAQTLADTDIPTTVKEQTPTHVTDMIWDSPLGEATYTGAVEPDSVYGSSKLIPHGKGIAKITAGQYSGSRYEGIFVWGNMNGEATYTYKNGDTFVGTFRNNEYYKGKYTQKSNGEYFEGTFKNGQPDKGTWRDKNGKTL